MKLSPESRQKHRIGKTWPDQAGLRRPGMTGKRGDRVMRSSVGCGADSERGPASDQLQGVSAGSEQGRLRQPAFDLFAQ